MPILSIIILSYNTKEITRQCLDALVQSLDAIADHQFEIIVVDNASEDGSREMLRTYKQSFSTKNISFQTIFNAENEGFPKGNNAGVVNATGTYILFLNSDVIIKHVSWSHVLSYLDAHPDVGALTVRVTLLQGQIDPASHRGFPTVWNSFCYYSQLEKLTRPILGLNRIFGGYHLTSRDLSQVHTVDAISGAFFLARARVIAELQGFDETFFMYGEDLDLAYRMKEAGQSIVYYPEAEVLHLKYQSGLKKETDETEQKTKKYFYDAMRIFYRKHYEARSWWILNRLVYTFINIKEQL